RVPFPDGVRTAVEFPFGDVPLARHAGGARVVTTMVIPGVAAPVVRRLSGMLPKLGPLVERLPEGPSPNMRARAKFRILAEALGPGGRAAVLCEGRDVYGLTARFLVAAAQKVSGAGAMAPAEALDPVPFFDAVNYQDWGEKILCVRVNAWDTKWTYGDVIEVVGNAGERLEEVMLPKVQSAAEVVALDLLLTQVEINAGLPPGHVGIEAQIETARGIIN